MVISDRDMTMKARTAIIPAGEFKAKCLSLLDEVELEGRVLTVTKRGRPVARIVPLHGGKGSLVGSLLQEGDLLAPVDVQWDANE